MAKKTGGTRSTKAVRAGGQKRTTTPARGAAKRAGGKSPAASTPRGAKPAAAVDEGEEGLSPAECRALKQHVEGEIDLFLREMGYTNLEDRIDEDGGRHFEMGAAEGTAFAMIEEDDVIYHVFAPVADVPADNRRAAPLMRELLGINAVLSGSVRLGVLGDTAYAMVTKSAQLMDDEDYGEFIHEVAVVGDIAVKELRRKHKK